MTFNIRYDNPDDGINSWENRKINVYNLITTANPDFLGIQEGRDHQVDFLKGKLQDFSAIGMSREGENIPGEFCSIFYKKDAYELLESRSFWLSPTPEVPSTGWDASFKRICTYGLFRNKRLERNILVFNTHFDHLGAEARLQSAQLIHSKISELNIHNLPVILMGDLNAGPSSEPIEYLRNIYDDSELISETPTLGPVGTFNGFNPQMPVDRKIDYIFTKELDVREYRHIDVQFRNLGMNELCRLQTRFST